MFKMIPNIIENLFTTKSTRPYPRLERNPFAGARGELYNMIEECIFCTACALKCPSSCIKVDRKQATWEYDPFACVYCGTCVETCPPKCLHIKEKYRSPVQTKTMISLKGEVKKRPPLPTPPKESKDSLSGQGEDTPSKPKEIEKDTTDGKN